MRVPQYRTRNRDGINMTPMIDVVFLLIIFFLVSSHLSRQETRMELELPSALSAEKENEQNVPKITINVKEDGTLWTSGRIVNLTRLKQILIETKRNEGDNIAVRIRGSQTARFGQFEPIMMTCVEVGIWNVSYAVEQKNRGQQ